jgi:hypothetical protein
MNSRKLVIGSLLVLNGVLFCIVLFLLWNRVSIHSFDTPDAIPTDEGLRALVRQDQKLWSEVNTSQPDLIAFVLFRDSTKPRSESYIAELEHAEARLKSCCQIVFVPFEKEGPVAYVSEIGERTKTIGRICYSTNAGKIRRKLLKIGNAATVIVDGNTWDIRSYYEFVLNPHTLVEELGRLMK